MGKNRETTSRVAERKSNTLETGLIFKDGVVMTYVLIEAGGIGTFLHRKKGADCASAPFQIRY